MVIVFQGDVAAGLNLFGTGACLPWCSNSSSFQNSLKMSGHRGYEFLEFQCRNSVPFLPDIIRWPREVTMLQIEKRHAD